MKSYLHKNLFNLMATMLLVAAFACGFIAPDHAGLGLMFSLATTAFPVNPELTAIAIAFQNSSAQLIADQVLPRIPVPKKFVYTSYTVSQGYTVPATQMGRKAEPNMVDFGGTLNTVECVDYGLDDLVPNDEVAAWESMPKPSTGGPVNPMQLSTMMLTGLIQLDREIRVAGKVFNAANYSGTNQATLSGTSKWSDPINSNPLNAIVTALDVPLVRPNSLVLGQQAWTQLRQHPKIVQAIGHSAQLGGYATRQQVAELLELDQIIVGMAFYNTAKKGQTPTYVRAWGKNAALLHIDSLAAQLQQPTFGWTGQWGTKIAGEIPEPTVGLRGGVRVRCGESVQEVIASTDAGYYFQSCVA